MSRVVCFGEIMMRLSPPDYQRFVQAKSFDIVYGGGEANVAISLANFGIDSRFVTRLPANPLGDAALNELRRFGVDVTQIVRGGQRLGIYFAEKGAAQRASKVVYDRKASAISEAKPGDIDWAKVFEGASWFHFTGITPALGDSVAALAKGACEAAKKLGLTVSCDLNFRKNLWTRDKAGQVMAELMPHVDLLIANEEDAEKVFGIKAESSDITGGTLSREGYEKVAHGLVSRFGFKRVAITLRESLSASDNNWSGLLYDGGEFYASRKYGIHIVDRVGGGDSFAAGLIYGIQAGLSSQECIDFAAAASCLKHTIEGDFNLASIDEVKALMAGDASGRVQR